MAVARLPEPAVIGLGVVTYERPERLRTLLGTVEEFLDGQLDAVVVYVDGGGCPGPARAPLGGVVVRGARNEGVAAAKNAAARLLLGAGCDWVFLAEDDMLVRAPEAVSGYVEAARRSGWEHLAFHGHGPANDSGPCGTDPTGAVTYWPSLVGAWCLYSRRSLEEGGLFDEGLVNAWEHVEHTLRLSLRGFHPLPEGRRLRAADATGSEAWVAEQPGAIEDSVIRRRPDWEASRRVARERWRATSPATYELVFPRG